MNTKVLLRTVDKLQELEKALKSSGFDFKIDDDKIEILVPFKRLSSFEQIIKKHLNASFNYANVKFPEKKLNVLIFLQRTFSIDSIQTNNLAKEWAISEGLPEAETEWTTVY